MLKRYKIPIIIVSIFLLIIAIAITAWLLLRPNTDTTSDSTDADTSTTDSVEDSQTNVQKPQDSVRLIFIHHSTGENWLSDDDGQLGIHLRDNNYLVSDTNYGWGTDSIGDRTDIGNWWEWFRGPSSGTFLEELYNETEQNSDYSRLANIPEGENEIILFKSCYPNSDFSGSSNDSVPTIDQNPLKSNDTYSEYHTVANAKGIYTDLLEYFKTRQDKLFVVITAPPLGRNNTDQTSADNARHSNNWLGDEWLAGYDYDNVSVFDFYDVLTNYGESNFSEYPTDESDDHPNAEGNLKATEEFIPFLNAAYGRWKESD